eukprot:TRINITY_DN2816_c0_g1_i1.p1 TRINITY_DN2816_c0_g1~~TRINITY_DN2816_c0_g1_i1.p1  ORF type:complete len:272 (-),score=79.17 TRINITY_DN2816_c0_g1_i1:137-952(-)
MSSGDHFVNVFLSGAASGVVSTIVTAPLELVKTVFQSQSANNTTKVNLRSCLQQQFRQSGVKGCFRGLAPTLVGIVPHNACFFFMYDSLRDSCKQYGHNDLTASVEAAMVAGSVANVVTNPAWVIKTKMSTQPEVYPTMLTSAKKIYKSGPRVFMSGVGASILGVSHVAVQFPVYEYLKSLNGDQTGLMGVTAASFGSKLLACGATYPLDVIRAQMQYNGETGAQAALRRTSNIWAQAGLQGFYRGFNVNMMKSVPATVITLSMYEIFKKF